MQNGWLRETVFIDDMGSSYPFKNRLEQSTQKGEMGGLFEQICIQSRIEGASTAKKMNRMHADLQIEVEKQLLIDD